MIGALGGNSVGFNSQAHISLAPLKGPKRGIECNPYLQARGHVPTIASHESRDIIDVPLIRAPVHPPQAPFLYVFIGGWTTNKDSYLLL